MFKKSRFISTPCLFVVAFTCFLIGALKITGYIKGVQYKPTSYLLNKSDAKTDRGFILVNHDTSHFKSEISKQTYKSLNANISTLADVNPKNGKDVKANDVSYCRERDLKLFDTARPVIGLVSFPGSGNTWTRHLVQQLTGIGTSSVDCARELRDGGFPYECERMKERTILVKAHKSQFFPIMEKIVLLVRNPYDALLSFLNFLRAGHTRHPSNDVLARASQEKFDYMLNFYISLFRNITETFKGPVHVVQYETLKSDMAKELRKLATFLNVSVSDDDINCTVKSQEGHFHRHTSEAEHIEQLRLVFNEEKLARLREAARQTEKLIKDAYNKELDLGGSVEKALIPY